MPSIDWARVEIGQELPPRQHPAITKQQLVMYAGASGDFNLIHTDVETARAAGLTGTIAHGMLSMGFLAQYAGELAGDHGFVQRLKVRFSGMVFPGDVLTCRAQLLARDAHQHTVTVQLWAEREPDHPLTTGEAVVLLREMP
ncbi:MAG: MaoC family dehydratase N-terminal domain-containing protein [Ktedonobacterales bacterium]|nr:MaoC family dehydratase N-terminal domain-containing protein [Ktedonobacterales bacterium]